MIHVDSLESEMKFASESISVREFLKRRPELPVIDVRAPAEFAKGHVPGAVNVPLFDDEQRALIGTTYKQQGQDQAIRLGLDLANPRKSLLIQGALQACDRQGQSGERSVLLYCARGGMRSQSVSWLLQQNRISVFRLEGGYKAFRRAVHQYFELPWNLIALTGMTGSGKTRLLQYMSDQGDQVLDLERLAHHRGSAFGGIGQSPQPSTEQFENRIFEVLQGLDRGQVIWVEDESRSVGRCVVPGPFFEQLHAAPAVSLDVGAQQRVDYLVEEYGNLNQDDMISAIHRITKRLGGQHAKAAIAALEAGDLTKCAEILLVYYDRTYHTCQIKNPRDRIVDVNATGLTLEEQRRAVLRAAEDLVDDPE